MIDLTDILTSEVFEDRFLTRMACNLLAHEKDGKIGAIPLECLLRVDCQRMESWF